MEDYPHDTIEFDKRFSTEESCIEYLHKIRWLNGFACLSCGSQKSWVVCAKLNECARCGHQTSVIAGTIFQDTKKPLFVWFRAIWQITSQKYGANALGLQRVLGFGSYRTAWAFLHKLRRAMVRPGRDRINGVVQVDETFVGASKPGKRGRGAEGKTIVLIAAECRDKRIGRIRLKRIEDASSNSLENAILNMISPGSKIITDGWIGYNRLEKLGYIHEISRKESSIGDDLLPKCHRIAGLMKR